MDDEKYICNKCNGKGHLPTKNPDVVKMCPKCHGKKELDWIENVVGVTKTKEPFDIHKDMMDILAEQIAKKVDEDIVNELIKTGGQ